MDALAAALSSPLSAGDLEGAANVARQQRAETPGDLRVQAVVEALELLIAQTWLGGTEDGETPIEAFVEGAQALGRGDLSAAEQCYARASYRSATEERGIRLRHAVRVVQAAWAGAPLPSSTDVSVAAPLPEPPPKSGQRTVTVDDEDDGEITRLANRGELPLGKMRALATPESVELSVEVSLEEGPAGFRGGPAPLPANLPKPPAMPVSGDSPTVPLSRHEEEKSMPGLFGDEERAPEPSLPPLHDLPPAMAPTPALGEMRPDIDSTPAVSSMEADGPSFHDTSWSGLESEAPPPATFEPAGSPVGDDRWGSSESPSRASTMEAGFAAEQAKAEELVKRGELGMALAVYQDLASSRPDDQELWGRIEEIAKQLQAQHER